MPDKQRSEEELEAERLKRRDHIEGTLSAVVHDLSPLERRFVIEYLSQTKPNATQAYLAAGGESKYPDRSAYQIRHRPRVQEAIDAYFRSQEMSAREVVMVLSEQAWSAQNQYLRKDPETNELEVDVDKLLADGKGYLIKGVNYVLVGKNRYKQIVEFYDGQRALVKIGEYHALFKNKVDVTSDGEKIEAITYIVENRPDDDA